MNIAVPVLNVGKPRAWEKEKRRYRPRRDVLCEVVAGFLWIALEIPEEASREEVEGVASVLIENVKADCGEGRVEEEVLRLQRFQLCRSGDPERVRAIVPQLMSAIRPG